MLYTIETYGLTDLGLVRTNNEDLWAELPDILTYILVDGMGGHKAGEVAASQAVIGFCEYMKKMLVHPMRKLSIYEMRSEMEYAIQRVNAKIYRMAYRNPELKGMGTTLACVHFHPKGIVHAHVGDSRIYRLRGDSFIQLTEDHSMTQEMIEVGQLNEKEFFRFTYKNIITRAVGTEPYVDPVVHISEVRGSDLYLLCSDGLTDYLSIGEMQLILSDKETLRRGAEKLVRAAKEKGGHDNITVVLIKIREGGDGRANLLR